MTGLAFAQTPHPSLDRLTVTFIGGDARRLRGQLTRTVDVVSASDLSDAPSVVRETALIRLSVPPERSGAAHSFAATFGGRIIDHDHETVLLELTADPARVDACIAASYVVGVQDIVRSGRLAIPVTEPPNDDAAPVPLHQQADGMSETLITEQ